MTWSAPRPALVFVVCGLRPFREYRVFVSVIICRVYTGPIGALLLIDSPSSYLNSPLELIRPDKPPNVNLPKDPSLSQKQQRPNFPPNFPRYRPPIPSPFIVQSLPPSQMRRWFGRGDKWCFSPNWKDGCFGFIPISIL
jgi:hypothetical protein